MITEPNIIIKKKNLVFEEGLTNIKCEYQTTVCFLRTLIVWIKNKGFNFT